MQSADFVATLFDGRSNPAKVTVAFTMALNALEKGHNTMVLLMVEAVELGQPGATEGIDVGQPFEPVSDLLAKFVLGGGRIGICKSCMIHNGFTEAQMAPGYEIVSAPEVIDLMMAAKGSLQIT
ncbi:DsrE family protein [Aquamicrobium defluvii]|uniref:Sulfur reduction protein DsrE n=1 Tax=Aquamicrobium defluvii TaxID=69279 RepID=A0A011TFN8_9HYPH|nr:DsrE family protein [Aquamicrobium defluvii]EXL02722.1 sulfur reduction protein DsrE [Aquamicrobium defluvii]EZQ13234.1 sulfur reduction protein DsrE [Halopseudomonas bauzanensis]